MEYKYGMTNRPPAFGGVPHRLSYQWDQEYRDSSRNIRHGFISCDRELTKEEIYSFELVDMNNTAGSRREGDIMKYPETLHKTPSSWGGEVFYMEQQHVEALIVELSGPLCFDDDTLSIDDCIQFDLVKHDGELSEYEGYDGRRVMLEWREDRRSFMEAI